jgi:SAM-dependent methyltransferase
MGRYSKRLAPPFVEFARVDRGPALDVGCGPGALTAVLVERFGPSGVSAADPSEPLVEAARSRHPGVRVELAPAEDLPFPDAAFAASLAQLVVHFMADPVVGLREMARVTQRRGVVAACVWDLASEQSPLGPFWKAAREVDPEVVDESRLAGGRNGHLTELFTEAGLNDIEDGVLTIHAEHASFDEYWAPFALGVGPAGSHVARLDEAGRAAIRERCHAFLGDGPFTLTFRAWAVRGVRG